MNPIHVRRPLDPDPSGAFSSSDRGAVSGVRRALGERGADARPRRPFASDDPPRATPPPTTLERVLRSQVRVFMVWILVYLVLQGQDGFFARTVDVIDATWLKLTVFNVPLHLALTVAVLVCADSRRAAVHRVGLLLGSLNVLLIVTHVTLSILTA